MKRALLLTAGILVSLLSCLPARKGFHADRIPVPQLREDLPVRGFGTVKVAFNGELHTGNFDMHYGPDGSFYATFYTPLGTLFGSISMQNDSGKINIRGKEHSLSINQTLDTLSFPWARELRLSDLVTSISGKVISSIPMNRPPDQVISKGLGKEFVWKEGKKKTLVTFSGSLKRLKRIIIVHEPDSVSGYSIIYDSFFDGFARLITFQLDDRNYFLIDYEQFKSK